MKIETYEEKTGECINSRSPPSILPHSFVAGGASYNDSLTLFRDRWNPCSLRFPFCFAVLLAGGLWSSEWGERGP